MAEQVVQIGLVGPNPPEIIGLKSVRSNKSGGYDSVGEGLIKVNLSVHINGTVFTIKTDQMIPMELFQFLQQGSCQATAELKPFQVGQTDQMPQYEINTKQITKPSSVPNQSSLTELRPVVDSKRQSVFKTRLGTSGKKKYHKASNHEVTWVDIVELAQKDCGSNCNLANLYQWAHENIYCVKDNRNVTIDHLTNWEASIRQNRQKAKCSTSKPSSKAKLNTPPKSETLPTAANLNDEMTTELGGLDELGVFDTYSEGEVDPESINSFDENSSNENVAISYNFIPTNQEVGFAVREVGREIDQIVNDIKLFARRQDPEKVPMLSTFEYQLADL